MANQYTLRKRGGYNESLCIEGVMVDRQRLEEKLWEGVDTSGYCWETPRVRANGRGQSSYGHIFLKKICEKGKPKRSVLIDTHRLSYILANGPIPDGLVVRHKCNNKACIRPAHLLVGTHGDNSADASRDGLLNAPCGENHPRAILTGEQVIWARNQVAHGMLISDAARHLSVSYCALRHAVRGCTWRSIPGAMPTTRRYNRRPI